MKLHFKKISYKNFMSVGDNGIEILLDKSPNTLICGHNGAGKSVLLEALTFVLFGKSYRGINKPSLVNSVNQKDCVVKIWFSKGSDQYEVTRGISPTVFTITKNGQTLDNEAAMRDQQEFFEESILESSFKTFSQFVIVGAASYTPFMKLTASQRREMVEDILNIDVFSQMNKSLKSLQSAWKTDYTDTKHKIEKAKSEISLLKDFIRKANSSKESDISDLQTQLNSHLEKARKIKAEIDSYVQSDIEVEQLDLIEYRKEIQEIHSDIQVLNHEIKNQTKLLVFFENHNVCPTCTQSIDMDFKKTKICDLQELIRNAEESKTDKDNALQSRNELVKSIQEKIDNEAVKRNRIKNLKQDMAFLKEQVLSTKAKLDKLKTSGTVDVSGEVQKVKDVSAKLEVYNETLKDLEVKKSRYDIAAKLLKDDGIKSKIIKKYVPILNSYVNKYLRILNFNVTFELDENFNENLKTRYKNEFRYSNFSMGERQRLDLAIMFAWLQVARSKNSVSTNLLLLDEVEGHLDKGGSDDVLEIAENLGEDMNIFVISHKETMEDRIRSIIRFEKVNGFTKIVP